MSWPRRLKVVNRSAERSAISSVKGYATIGAIGFDVRLDYAAIGTVTSLGARLCGEARAGQILVSQCFLGTVEDLVEAEPVGKLSLKGFLRPVTTFNVLRLREDAVTREGQPSCASATGS